MSGDADKLRLGAFYWVRVALDPDADHEWENDLMPARYAGDGQWFFLNVEGPSDWAVRWVGPEIVPPTI